MLYQITNGTKRGKAFRSKGNLPVVLPNETVTLDIEISDEKIAELEAQGVMMTLVEAPDDGLDDLRAQYESRCGKAPDKRWGASRLLDELTKADE